MELSYLEVRNLTADGEVKHKTNTKYGINCVFLMWSCCFHTILHTKDSILVLSKV